MIEKFISIKNIGQFRDCRSRGNVTFGKLTLLYAENGRGKTTLCSILRSLQSGKPEFISERKTLGTNDPASVQIRLSGNNIAFTNDAWSATHPEIEIFDSVFIHNNVYAGDYVDHEHRKNLYRVVVGANGAKLAKDISELDGKIREANRDITSKKEAVSKTLPSGTTIDDYLAWRPCEDIDMKIQQKTVEITARQRILEKAAEVQSKGLLSKAALPVLPSDFTAILSKQLADVTTDAEARVRAQTTAHKMGNHGETWLSQGLLFLVDDSSCPFCGQGIQDNDLITAYNTHFNEAYKALKQEVAQLGKRIATSIGEAALGSVQQTFSNNATLVEFWKQFAEIDLPDLPIEEVKNKYATLCELAMALAQKKQQSPIEPVSTDDAFQAALDTVTNLQESVDAYSAAIDRCNALINEQKASARQGADITTLKQELSDLEAKKKRFEPSVVQACQEYQTALTLKTTFELQKTTAKKQLDEHCKQILQKYESSINAFLDQFNTGFTITNSRHRYTGGTPSSHYQILINDNAVELGDSQTPPGTPSFKTALSSGDRSALALSFFLAALNQDSGLPDKIVVLDDPFTSQDHFRRTCTQQLIRQFASKAKQVVVLSHEPHFLRLIWEGYATSGIQVLQLHRSSNSTVIGEWDIESDTQSDYMKNFSTLLNFYHEREGAPLAVARSIRPFLEGMLRARFPGQFQPGEWLGDFIDKVRSVDEPSRLSHAKADLSEIEAINDYSKKYHHEQNTSANPEPLSEDELHGFVKRTLRLVGGVHK